jgi:hypothetical protein
MSTNKIIVTSQYEDLTLRDFYALCDIRSKSTDKLADIAKLLK